VISASGVSTCPDKVKAMVEWSVPNNVKELRSFLGLASYITGSVSNILILF
jgi:hypothetical protein